MSSPSSDVIVIGAGIIGGSIAWRLARAGLRVTILEAGVFGGEASWAGAGMLAPGGEIAERSVWSELALESLRLYRNFVGELESESGHKIDYRQSGAVEIACSEDEAGELRARREAQTKLGIVSIPLDRGVLRSRVPLLERECIEVFFYPEDTSVDPRDIMQALKVVCSSRNVRIQERRRALSVQIRSGVVEVETESGTLSAAAGVLAAGAWSGQISVSIDGARQPLPASFPVRGHLLGYALEPHSLGPILRRGHTYLLQRASGYTIAGSSAERVGFDRNLDPQVIGDISERACELLPRLRLVPPPDAWLGFRPATENFQPEIRRLGDSNLWLAYGHYRNGILLAPATAQSVSREIISSSGRGSTAPAGNR